MGIRGGGEERPVREGGDGLHDRYTEKHPAFAMMGASRVSSTPGAVLLGSDFRHQHYMTVAIHGAEYRRGGGSADWYFADRLLIEVAMSEAQWATFVATPNVGHGVPVTLQWRDGPIPSITPGEDRRHQFREEVDERLQAAVATMTELRDAAPTKKLRALAEQALRQMTDGLPWVAKQFDEHAENTVEKMKVEVSAYMQAAITNAGLKALGAAPPLELIESGDSSDSTEGREEGPDGDENTRLRRFGAVDPE